MHRTESFVFLNRFMKEHENSPTDIKCLETIRSYILRLERESEELRKRNYKLELEVLKLKKKI